MLISLCFRCHSMPAIHTFTYKYAVQQRGVVRGPWHTHLQNKWSRHSCHVSLEMVRAIGATVQCMNMCIEHHMRDA